MQGFWRRNVPQQQFHKQKTYSKSSTNRNASFQAKNLASASCQAQNLTKQHVYLKKNNYLECFLDRLVLRVDARPDRLGNHVPPLPPVGWLGWGGVMGGFVHGMGAAAATMSIKLGRYSDAGLSAEKRT